MFHREAIKLLKNLKKKARDNRLKTLIAYNLSYLYVILLNTSPQKEDFFKFCNVLLEYIQLSRNERAMYYFAYNFLPRRPKDSKRRKYFYIAFRNVKELFPHNQFLNYLFEAYYHLIKDRPGKAETSMKQVYLLSRKSPNNRELFEKIYPDYEETYRKAESNARYNRAIPVIVGLLVIFALIQSLLIQKRTDWLPGIKKEGRRSEQTHLEFPKKSVVKQERPSLKGKKEKASKSFSSFRKKPEGKLAHAGKALLLIKWPVLKREYSRVVFAGEFKNTGDFPVTSARLTIFFLDNSGKVRQDVTEKIYFSPPLYPGCSRKFSISVFSYYLPSSWKGRYRMDVEVLNYTRYFTPLKLVSEYDRHFRLHNVRRKVDFFLRQLEIKGEVENLDYPWKVDKLYFRVYFLGDKGEIIDFKEASVRIMQKLIKNYIAKFHFSVDISHISRRWKGKIKLSIIDAI